jgi:hypothetical protein
MSPLWIPLVILTGITLLVVIARAWPAGNRTSAVFDCGVEGCRYRNRTNHHHKPAAA